MTLRGAFVAASFALCGYGCAHAHGPARDTLVIADSWEPRSLDPLVLQGTQVAFLNNLVFSYLLDVDNDGNPIPQVALQVPTLQNGGISPDGKTIRYHLRRDVRFSDGVPLTARDAVATFEAIVNPRNAAASRYGYDVIASANAPNDGTLVVRLRHPFSPIVSTFLAPGGNYGIFPARLVRSAVPLERSAFATAPVGSGPYVVTRWDRGDRIVLSANPHYYGKRPAIGHVVWRFIPSPQTMVSQLRTGEVDAVFGAPPDVLPELRNLANHRILVTPEIGLAQLQFNTEDPVFGDVRVRRAFVRAVDWPRIVSRATEGAFTAGDALRGVFGWAYDRSASLPAYDPRAASSELDSAGWTMGADGIRRKGTAALEAGVAVSADEATLARVLTQVQADAARVGIRIVPHVLAKSLYKSLDGPIAQGRYQLSMDRFASAPDPDPGWLVGCGNRAPHGFNRSRYCDALVDAAMADAVRTYDRARRRSDYATVQQQLVRAVPLYPIYQEREIDVVPERLRGFIPSTQELQLQGIQNWSLAAGNGAAP